MDLPFIFKKISKQQLIHELTCREITERTARTTIAYVEHPGALWRVVDTTARIDGPLGLKAGETRREIFCDVIRRDEDTGELGVRSIPESEKPYDYSCPLHFFELAPVVYSPEWREFVRGCHADAGKREGYQRNLDILLQERGVAA